MPRVALWTGHPIRGVAEGCYPRSIPMAWIANLGASVRRFLEHLGNVARLGWLSLRALMLLRHTQLRTVVPVIKAQIRFTGIDALGLVCAFALLLGVITLIQAYTQLEGFGGERYTGVLLVAVVIRELGPLLAAVLVIGRSATAMAAELAAMGLNGELDALAVHGVDPVAYVLAPRVLAGMISVLALMAFMDLSALVGGYLVAHIKVGLPFPSFVEQIQASLTVRDILVTLLKGPIFGGGIALIACYSGLRVKTGFTEIPQAVTKAVVACLMAVFLVDGLLVAWFYA